ncbi:MAG: transcriptional regulator [Actinomycetes bacterium]
MAGQRGSPTEGRVYFRDVKPYEVVDSLDQLRGPSGGVVELSHSVLWAPGGGRVDLDEPGGVGLAYRAVLAEGSIDDLVHVLNRDRLIEVWPELMLPRRVRDMWESRFPELRRVATA